MKKPLFFALIGSMSIAMTSASTALVRASSQNSSSVFTVNGVISSLSINKDAFKMASGGHTVEVLLGTSFSSGPITISSGDTVSVTGTAVAQHYTSDPTQVKAKTLTDNGTFIDLHPVSTLSTYTSVPITALSSLRDGIRILSGSKTVEIHIGKLFFSAHPLAVGDRISIIGHETVGMFSDSPTHIHPTSITINGTTYSHFGK